MLSLNQLSEQKLYLRKSTKNMSYKSWESYKRGIRVMKERSKNNLLDPTGFTYQAYMHAWPPYNATKQDDEIVKTYGWHSCQHEQFFFFPWHRMSLYFFERILRKASNDPDFTLPYWDYSSAGSDRSMPDAFRIPANELVNPLYLATGRCEACNKGMALRSEITDASGPLRSRFYESGVNWNPLNVCHSFGGGRVDKPVFTGGVAGLAYIRPHSTIHTYVGGANGVFSNPCLAALDPIFQVHHIQIDRLWESWRRLGGIMPNDKQFLEQRFNFFDENGRRVSPRVKDFLNITNLKYTYDSYVEAEPIVPILSEPELYIDLEMTNTTNDLVITYEKRSIVTDLTPYTKELFSDLAEDAEYLSKVRFTLQYAIDFIEPSVNFDIYVNLNRNMFPYNQNPFYITSIARFRGPCVVLTPEQRALQMGDVSGCLEMTDKLRQIIKREYHLNGCVSNRFNITIVARDCAGTYFMNGTNKIISFKFFYLVHIFEE